jgi:ADP-ribose pyrophosphatase YjhB (NUDIX family)
MHKKPENRRSLSVAMPVFSVVSVAIIDDNHILLIQREDFRVWGLPGGDIDPGESLAQAAVREVREETGLTVILTRLVGLYALVGAEQSVITTVFTARPAGGVLSPDPREVSDIGWFTPESLPADLMWWHRQRIQDALAGVTGAVWRQEGGWPFPPGFTRRDLYAARDASGLPRTESFRQLFPHPGADAEILELPDITA